jgi:hypothetical protein
MRIRIALVVGIALIVGIIFTACCPKPTPAPQPGAACPKGAPPSDQTQLEACLNGIEFDSTYEASDSQPLTVIDSTPSSSNLPCPGDRVGSPRRCRYGPIAKIEPAIGAQSYSEEDLRQGRIIARLWIPATEKEDYPKYNLKVGLRTYWWVRTDETGEKGKSVFLTIDQRGAVDTLGRTLQRERYREDGDKGNGRNRLSKWWRAVARWIWSLEDEVAKGKCGAGGCS